MENRPIQKLSDEVIGQIAAGEVVERPAAAVKELVENSIDAGATSITVELRDGGISYMRVSDNGKGIPASQIRMAFERHATSKLVTSGDLFDVHTLGFRGEALASIAAVAKVSCTTRVADAAYGVKAQVDAGEFADIAEAASPIGTTILVKDLFFNAPVRLKFLKKPASEAALVSDYMMRLILSHPEIAFRFVNQGKTVYHSAGDGKLDSAIYCIYGKDTLRSMRRVHGISGGVIVDGFVGVGELSRGNRVHQSFFVNGRYFRDDTISKALENGCEGFVMIGRYPCCVLKLEMQYGQVDVNVHPNKLEVRFQNIDAVATAVEQSVSEALRAVTIREQLIGEPKTPVRQVAPNPVQVLQISRDEQGNALTEQLDAADSPQTTDERSAEAPQATEGAAAQALGETTRESVGISQSASALSDAEESTAPTRTQADSPVAVQLGESNAANVAYPQADQRSDALTASDQPANANQPLHTFAPVLHEASTALLDEGELSPAEILTSATAPMDEARGEIESQADRLAFASPTAALQIPVVPRAERTVPEEVEQQLIPIERPSVQLQFVGAVFKTYLLFETGDRLLLVDQHAAHERILYDRFMARYEKGSISQRLLTPQLVRLTARDCSLLREMHDAMLDAGFEIEAFDETCVAVHAIPVILGENESVRELLMDAMDEWTAQHGKVTRERLRRRVMQMACKHAIKGGDTLSQDDVRHLLEQMLQTGAQPTCPHGRPIVNELTKRELEKRFKRIQ